MHILYLGTGASEGMPAVFCSCALCAHAREKGGKDIRRRCSVLIDGELLIDLSPDIFFQSAAFGLKLEQVKYLLVTHTHFDHFYPMELRNLCGGYTSRTDAQTLQICGSGAVEQALTHGLGADNLQRLGPCLTFRELKLFEPAELGDYLITPLKARHCDGAFLYLVQKDGRTLLYGNDTGFLPEETWDFLKDKRVHLVNLDCTSPSYGMTPSHMSIEDNITVKRRMIQQKSADTHTRFVATHFSHTGYTHMELEERMRLYGFTVAYDGLSLSV